MLHHCMLPDVGDIQNTKTSTLQIYITVSCLATCPTVKPEERLRLKGKWRFASIYLLVKPGLVLNVAIFTANMLLWTVSVHCAFIRHNMYTKFVQGCRWQHNILTRFIGKALRLCLHIALAYSLKRNSLI